MRICVLLLFAICPVNSESEEYLYIDIQYPSLANEESSFDFSGNIRKLFAVHTGLLHEFGYNVVCSPLSAMLPLAKLLLGAKRSSKTEYEILDALGLERSSQLNSTYKQLISDIKNIEGVVIGIASKLYVSKSKRLKARFERKTRSIFGSSIELMNFNDPAQVANTINEWVYKNTYKRIDNIVSEKDISPYMSLLLVNAVYFKGEWAIPFHHLHNDIFTSPTGEMNVSMMSNTDHYKYIRSKALNAQIIQLPYRGEQSAMIIILPYSNDGLPILLRTLKITPELLNVALLKMEMTPLKVQIPKFKIETTLDLEKSFGWLGIASIFKFNESRLDSVVVGDTVYISKATHKAVIEVNELGTEAAAANVLQMVPLSLLIPNDYFKADHPFLFYIKVYHEQLFSGVVIKP